MYAEIASLESLSQAWHRVRQNNGAHGIDGETIRDIEAQGPDPWIADLSRELLTGTYAPKPTRQVCIPKQTGHRILNIPAIRDRVIQTSALMALSPVFECDLHPNQYGYRAHRNALEAVEHVKYLLERGYRYTARSDVRDYFDTIPRTELMEILAGRITDQRVLALLAGWIGAVKGVSQGSPIAPLLANLYMARIMKAWAQVCTEVQIINYADDIILLARTEKDLIHAYSALKARINAAKLELNTAKTRLAAYPDSAVRYLGMRIKQQDNTTVMIPDTVAIARIEAQINALTAKDKSTDNQSGTETTEAVTSAVDGWLAWYVPYCPKLTRTEIQRLANRKLTLWRKRKRKRTYRLRSTNSLSIPTTLQGITRESSRPEELENRSTVPLPAQ